MAEGFAARSPDTTLLVKGVSLENDQSFVDKTVAFLQSLGFSRNHLEIKLPNNFGGLYSGSPKDDSTGFHRYKDLGDAQLEMCSVLLNNPGVYVDGRVMACGCLDNSSADYRRHSRKESLRQMRYGARIEALLQAFTSEAGLHVRRRERDRTVQGLRCSLLLVPHDQFRLAVRRRAGRPLRGTLARRLIARKATRQAILRTPPSAPIMDR